MGTNSKRRARSIRQIIVILLLVGALCGGYYWYKNEQDMERFVEGSFVVAGKQVAQFRLEIADSPRTRQQGLMYRKPKDLESDQGMIFVFPIEKVQSFYMRNTYIPLDIVFVGQNYKTVGVLHDVAVLDETPRSVGKPSLYAVELNAGTAAKYGISDGAELRLARPLTARE